MSRHSARGSAVEAGDLIRWRERIAIEPDAKRRVERRLEPKEVGRAGGPPARHRAAPFVLMMITPFAASSP